MAVLAPLNEEMQQLADEHREWLTPYLDQHLANWEKLFKHDDQSAMTEASVRRLLDRHGVTVEPNECVTGSEQRPDFRCSRNGTTFYAEVTHISIAKATEESLIEHHSNDNPSTSGWRPLNDAIFKACRHKAKQCSSADGPVLLVIGTWHAFAAMASFEKTIVNMLLTGETKIAWNVDINSGQVGDTYQITELYSAAFLRPDATQDIGFARSSISGLLLVANGLMGKKPLGVLHPNPANDFDASLLPKIEFGRVEIDSSSGSLRVMWPGAPVG